MKDTSILTESEHAIGHAEALLYGDVEIQEDDKIHLTEKGIYKAFKLIRKRPEHERYLYVLLLKAVEETIGLLKE